MSTVETPFKLACRLFNQGYALKRNFMALLKDSVKEGYGMKSQINDWLDFDINTASKEAVSTLERSLRGFEDIRKIKNEHSLHQREAEFFPHREMRLNASNDFSDIIIYLRVVIL